MLYCMCKSGQKITICRFPAGLRADGRADRSGNGRRTENAAACGDYFGRERQMGQGQGDAPQLRPCPGGEDCGDHLRGGLPDGDTVPDCVRFLHGELEPAPGRGGRADEASAGLYEDLPEDRGEEPYVRQGAGGEVPAGRGHPEQDRGAGGGHEIQ